MKRIWAEKEENFLRDSWVEVCSKEIASHLNRSPKAVRNKASRMGMHALKRCYTHPKPVKEYTPSPSLAYLIGAIKGDGCVFRYIRKKPTIKVFYWIEFTTGDCEFASQVRQAVGEVIGRYPKVQTVFQHHTSASAGKKIFRLLFCDKSLYALLSQSIDNLRLYIEAYPADFLRGFFDAEGSAWIVHRRNTKKMVFRNGETHFVNRYSREYVVKFCNTDKHLLEYVRELLIKLRIFPAPEMFGTIGNLGKKRKICYNLHIYRKDSIRRFMRLVGSSIPRKVILRCL
jgi:intein-encoded DNA endonuclease-like protein